MLLWFVSGMVMLIIGYPKLTPGERLAALPVLGRAGSRGADHAAWRTHLCGAQRQQRRCVVGADRPGAAARVGTAS
ncbi:hypothetical protein G6F58_013320 [Rhizopus delemar]|nr:hypothetical protein G6F58_013320 [Rhizopus delemar]